eukprot:m.103684 g.103684  ORF g.103684 m.103684 type:complete len:127 (-) comp15588_c0_seq3:988-1368(-)
MCVARGFVALCLVAAGVALPSPSHPVVYQTIQTSPDVHLNVATAGAENGTASDLVLFLHGFPGASYLWRGVIDPVLHGSQQACPSKRFRLAMPDQRGYNNRWEVCRTGVMVAMRSFEAGLAVLLGR